MRHLSVNVTVKQHYKMYKAGKVWLFAAISSFAIGAGAFSAASISNFNTTKVAADVNTSAVANSNQNNASETTSQSISASTSQSTSASISTSTQLSASESTSQSMSASQSQSISTSVSQSASLSVSQSTTATSDQSDGLSDRIGVENQTQSSLSEGQSAANLGDSQQGVSAATTQPNQVEAKSETVDRTAFNSQVASNSTSNSSKTSITIAKSDQLTNMDYYRQQAQQNGTYASVNDWNSFSNAYSNDNIRFIDFAGDVIVPSAYMNTWGALKERTQSLIINGNGKTLNLGQNALRTGQSPNYASNGQGGSVLTITSLNMQQWSTDNSSPSTGKNNNGSQNKEGGSIGQPDAAIDAYASDNSYGGWIYNIDNVSLKGQNTSTNGYQAARLLDAEGSYVVLSGNINVAARYSMMRISKVDIANGANVNFQVAGSPEMRDTTDFVAPMFDFSTNATACSQRANATGNDHLFRVGDDASISGTSINYVSHNALVQGTYYGMYVGDNVTWTQDFYDEFINQKNYNSITHPDSGRQYIFGQNFTFNALNNVDTHGLAPYGKNYGIDGNAIISTQDNTNASIYFAPGLTFSINQINSPTAINLGAGTQIVIDAPKYFNVGARDATYGAMFSSDGSWNTAIYNFGTNATLTITDADVQSFDNYQSSMKTPTQNLVKGGSLVVTKNGVSVINRAGNTVANTGAGTTREIQAQNTGLGQVVVEYVDQNGQTIKTVQVPLTSQNLVGQRILLNGTEYAINQMPEGYMWALGSEIPAGAADDAQSGGDPTTADDNGDKSGQATIAIIPNSQFTNTYKIYVYGKPETVQYQYVDENTGKVVPGPLAGQTGTEDQQGMATANYGQTIDWANGYYTSTNVPTGYHYDQKNTKQPGKGLVSENNSLVTIYIAGNSQNITPTYQTKDGQTVTPDQNQVITGITGQTLSSLPQPTATGYSIYQTLVNGTVVDPTQSYTFGPSDSITFVYQTNTDRIADLTTQIENAETAANAVINNDQTLSTKEKSTQTGRTAAIRKSAIVDLNNTTGNGLNNIAQTAIANIQAVHMSNQPVNVQQANLLQQLKALAQQTKTSISNDQTILDANRGAQSSQVDTDVAAGLRAISSATDIDSIDDAYDTYSQMIAADHQPGDPISTQQANANSSISQNAQRVITAINNDPTLDSSQQATQVGLVNAAKNLAIKAVNQATNADQIATQVTNSTSFNTNHTQGESVADRQADAKHFVDGLVATVSQKISTDTGLNDAQKTQQGQNLTDAANVMYQAIQQATTADAINAAQNNQSNQQAIANAYVQATVSLSQQQQNAQNQVADWVKTITGQIQSDTSLESATRSNQVAAVNALANQVAGQIAKAQNAQQLQDLMAGTQGGVSVHDQLAAHHVAGTSLSDRINQAKTALEKEAQKISGQISQDPTLLEANRSIQLNNISAYLNTAENSIAGSADADAVNQNLADDLKNLDAIYVPGDLISTQQQNAIKKLAAKAADVQQNKIGADANLTSAQKQYQGNLINQVVSAATTDINKQTTAQTIWDREAQAEQSVAAQYEASATIQSAQQAALTVLQQANTNVTANINGEVTLSTADKQQQLAQLAKDYQTAQNNVNTAISSAAATAAGTSGQTTMTGDFHTGESVANRQGDAQTNLRGTYNQVIANISGDATLTTADRNQQEADAQSAYNRALTAVNSATTAQAVIDQTTSGNGAITATYKTGISLDTQRSSAKDQLDNANAQILAAINGDLTLQSSDRANQKDALAKAYGNAVAALNSATDAQGILDAEQNGIPAIDANHKSLESVAGRKQDAQQALDQENGRVQQLINNDTSLLTSEKNNQLAQLMVAYKQAQSNINQAQDADSVVSAQTTGVNSLAANHRSGTPFTQQQTNAEQAITDSQSTADQAIDGDASLLTTEKAAQKKTVDDAASQAQVNLQAATTAQTLVDVSQPALATINGAHKAGQDVTDRRNQALSTLSTKNQTVSNAITSDSNLLTTEQNRQLANLKTAYEAAQASLAATSAPDAQSIANALATGVSQLDAQHTVGQMTLAARIADAQSQLQSQNTTVANAIQNDPTLTTSDQNAQSTAVNQAYTAANNRVGTDTTAQTVADDLANGLAAINSSHKPGEALSQQQSDRIQQLQAQESTAKSTITNDPTLLTQDQNTQKNQVETYLQNAVAQINAAQNAQSVLTIYNSAVSQINGVHQAGTPLDSQKTTALAKLKAVNDQTNTAITTEPTLTNAQQSAEAASLATAYGQAQSAINGATTAQQLADNFQNQSNNLKSIFTKGTDITTQISNAQAAIKTSRDGLQAQISADVTLLDTVKTSQSTAVDSDYANAKTAIAGMTTAQAILDAQNQAIQKMTSEYVHGTDLATQKVNAKTALTNQAKTTKGDITNDATLTTADQNTQSDNVDSTVSTYGNNIDQATDAQEVADQQGAGINAIEADHIAGVSLSSRAATAYNTLASQAQQLTTAITNDNTLVNSQKSSQALQVQTDLANAQKDLNSAKTAQAIVDLQGQYAQTLPSDHKSNGSLADQLIAAQSSLSSYGNNVKGQINNDPTLLDADKTKQGANVDAAVSSDNATLTNAATSAQSLADALSKLEKSLDQLHQPGLDVATQQTNAKTKLAGVAKATKQTITNDPTLTEAVRQAQRDAVDQTVTTANTNITNANTAQAIADIEANAETAVGKDYQTGTSLEDQKKSAQGQLTAAYNAANLAIQNDVTLTNDAKQRQTATLNTNYQNGQNAIDAAGSAQLVSDTEFSWAQTLNNSHTVGKDLATQIIDAQTALKTQYTQTKNDLLADNTLLTAQNQQQAAKIDEAYNAAVASIDLNKTPNAQAIADAVTTGKANIQAQFKPGASIPDQQNAAYSVVNQAATDAINAINDDNTLTADDVTTQVGNIQAKVRDINNKIQAATDAQTIANLIVNVEERLASLHVPGQSVDTQKGAAGTAVNGAGDQAKQVIQGDPTLDQQTKNAQKDAINNIVSQAIAQIKAETAAAQIDADKKKAIADINAQHKQGAQISDQQTTAIAAITQEVTKVKNAIDQDNTLDSATKDSQKSKVDQDASQATTNIKAATTADAIAAAQTTGINNIDAEHQTGTGIPAQRQAALDKVQAEANSVKASIQADNTLDTAAVASQLANVDTALSAAQTAIQDAALTTADQIEQAKTDGITNIDKQYQPGKALDDQKSDAKAQLATYAGSNNSASGIWHDIDSDVTLTNDQKGKQEQALSDALNSANTAISNATNAQAIEDAVTNAKTAMTQAHINGAPVDRQAKRANQTILYWAQDAQSLIMTSSPSLTLAEKQDRMNQLNSVIQTAQSSLATGTVTNAQAINEIQSTALQAFLAIDNQAPQLSLITRRSQAVTNLDDELTSITSAINQDGTLLATDKSSQKQAAQQAHDAAVVTVQNARDAETIVEQLAAGIKNIDGAHSSGTAVATQQANAIAILTQTAKDTKKAITNDVDLLEATRTAQRNQIDADLQTAITAINGIGSGDATAADEIQADRTQWNSTIAGDHVAGTPLATQKASQKTALENYAGSNSNQQGVWSAIDTDVTLTDADKATQKVNLANALSTYEGRIDAAADAQSLNDLIAKADNAMDASHSAGASLADRRSDANKQIASQVAQVKAQIAADPTLTDADVISQNNAVDTAVKTLQAELANDQNAQAILDTVTNGLTMIAQQYQPQESLVNRRTDATTAIKQAVTDAKSAIDTDPTLNQADRTAQEAAVDSAVSSMTDDLNQADTAQKILNIQSRLVQAAAGVHTAGPAIADQQKTANAALEKTADQVNQAITADPALTNAQKTAERANVASALSTAEQVINGLNDAQQILDTKNQQIITIQNQHPRPRQLSDLISDTRQKFQTEYDGIHQAIQNDKTLNNSSRASQFATLSSALQAANDSLTGVNNAQQLSDIQDKGIKQIDSSHVVGTPLSQQIQAAKDQLTNLKNQLNDAVTNDVNLLDSSKTKREGLLTATLNKYTNQLDADNQPDSTADGQAVLDVIQAATTALNNDRTTDDGNGGSQDQPLADQIAAAIKQVSQKSINVQNVINGDNSLVQSMIDDQTAANTSISNQAITDIRAAVNAQGLADRLSTALQDLNGVYHTNPTSLDAQKGQAIQDFNALYGTVQGQIKSDIGLTSAQKATQLANLDQAKTQGTSQISNVSRAIDLAGIVKTVDADLNQAHQAGPSLTDLQQNEQNWYNQQVKNLATALSASQLSDADSQAMNRAITAAEETIQGQITAAKNADDLVAMHGSAVTTFANLTLQVKQAQARYTITTTAADQVQAINNDTSLTKAGTTGKDAQISQVNSQRDSILSNINTAQTTDQVATILSNGVTTLAGIHQSATQSFDQQKTTANTNATTAANAVSQAISAANSNQKITADQNSQLTGVVSQATDAFNTAMANAKNADDINAAVNQLNTTLANAQLALQKDQSTNAVNQAAQVVENAIDQDATLDADQKAIQKQSVETQKQTANQQIDGASTTDAAQAIENNFTSTVTQLHVAGQAIADRRANLKQLVASAVAAANRVIKADNTLDTAAKQAQLQQVINAQNTANDAIDAAQNAADGVQAEVNGVNTINAIHQAGPVSVDQLRANFLTLVNSLMATAKQNVTNATTLSAAQANKVLQDATFIHDFSSLNANDAVDADDFEALSNNVKSLYANVDLELHQFIGLQAITTAKSDAEQAIDAKNTLSDAEKTVQKTQVDGAFTKAQTAITQSQSSDAADQAAGAGVQAIQAIPTDGQTIQQRTADLIASLTQEAAKIKGDIDNDASLSTADRVSQKQAVDNAVSAGTTQIKQSTTVQDGVTATQNAINAIDASHQAGSLPTQKTAVTNTGVGYLKDLTSAIVHDTALQTVEINNLTDMVVQARNSFTASIKNAQDADSVNQALTDLSQAVQKITNQQSKYDAVHQLQQTASNTTSKIQTDNTLSASIEANQLAAVQQQLSAATNAVNAIAIDDSQAASKLSSALATGNQNITNSYQTGTPVADHQTAWQQAINDEATKVTNAINADPTLTGDAQQQQVAAVQTAKNKAIAQIEAVTSVQAGDTATANGIQAIDQVHVSGTPVTDQKQAGQATADTAIANEQKNIDDHTADLKPSDKSRLDQAVQDAKQAANTAMSQAQKADDITKAQNDLATKLAGIDLDLYHTIGQGKLDAANTQATNAIKNDVTLTGDAKQSQLQNLLATYQNASSALADTTTVAAANQSASDGVQAIAAVHQVGEDLAVQKKKLIANLQQADKSLKAKIDADNTLSQAQKAQQKQQIDTNEGNAVNGINQATDADSAKTLADNTASANTKAYVPGAPLDGQGGQRAAIMQEITDKSQAVIVAINQAAQAGTITTNQQGSLLQEVNVAVRVAQYYANQAINADQLSGASAQLASDLSGAQYDLGIDVAGYNILNAYNAALQSISDDPTLSIEEKANQSGTVNAELFRARRLLSASRTVDQVNQISADEIQRFATIHQNGQPVADRLSGFAEIISDEAVSSVQKVNDDNTISDAGKKVLTTAVNYMRDWFINELKQAPDVVTAENMVIDDLSSFRFEQKSLSSTALNKELAYKGVYDGIKTTDASINSNKNLTPEHLNELMNELATLTSATHEKVLDATSLSDTNDLLQSYTQSLAALMLKAKKQDASDQLTAAQHVVETAIANDGTLTAKQAANQTAAVDQAASQALQAVQADSEDQIQNTVTNGLQAIMAAHQPQGGLTTQLPAMDKQVDDATAAATAAVNGDATLSTDDKAKQIAAINKQASDTKQSMANAANTRSAESIMTNGLNTLNQIHQPGQSIADQKQQALNQGTATDSSAKDQVPTKQSEDANPAIDAAKQKLIDDLNKAQNKDDINRATAEYNQQVQNIVNVAQKKQAAADQAAKTAQDAQQQLPASQTDRLSPAVKQAEKDYQEAIKHATSPDEINQATKQYHDALNKIVQDANAQNAADQRANAQHSPANTSQAAQQNTVRHGGDAQQQNGPATIDQTIINNGLRLAEKVKNTLPSGVATQYQLAIDRAVSQLILALANAKSQADIDRAYAQYAQTLQDIAAQAKQATRNQFGSTLGEFRLPDQPVYGQTKVLHNNSKATIILAATAATLSFGLVATVPHFKLLKWKGRR